MYKYKIVYQYSNGCEGEEIISAPNRWAALELFSDFGYEDLINIDCYRVIDDFEEMD